MHLLVFAFSLLLISLVGTVAVISDGALHIPATTSMTMRKEGKKLKFPTLKDIKIVSSRVPHAILKSVEMSGNSFVSTSCMTIPFSLGLSLNKINPVDAWLMAGVQRGAGWAKVSAIFAGSEALVANLRNKHDPLNKQLASGISSCILRYKEGPRSMATGFVMGFGVMYSIDKIFPTRTKKVSSLSTQGPVTKMMNRLMNRGEGRAGSAIHSLSAPLVSEPLVSGTITISPEVVDGEEEVKKVEEKKEK